MTACTKYNYIFNFVPEILDFYKLEYENHNFGTIKGIDVKINGQYVAEIIQYDKNPTLVRLSGAIGYTPIFHHDGRKADIYNASRRLHLLFDMLVNNVEHTEIDKRMRYDIRETGR